MLVVGALIGLTGCQHVPSRPGVPAPLGLGNEPKGGGTITPAQEADVQISMGRQAEQQGDFDQAMAAYRAALDRDRRRADAYARMAVLHDKQGKFRESADLYRKALAMRPGDPDIFCDMGYSFYLQRRWAEAEMNLRQSIAINPEHRRAHNNLALLLVRDNRLGDALAEFGRAGNSPVQAHMNLAFALTIVERWESARAEYQRALALDPSSQLAKARLDELNNLLAKREPAAAPEGVRGNPPQLTAETAAPSVRRGPAVPTTTPPQADASSVRRDPALLTTAAVSPGAPQGYRPATRVASQSLPAEGEAMRRARSTADSTRTAPTRPRPDVRTYATSATAPRERHDSHPQRDAAPLDDSSTGPDLAIDSSRTAPASTRRPDRVAIPPPRACDTREITRPDAHPPVASAPIPAPRSVETRRITRPAAQPPAASSPIPPPRSFETLGIDRLRARPPAGSTPIPPPRSRLTSRPAPPGAAPTPAPDRSEDVQPPAKAPNPDPAAVNR
ncbi:MAG: tetratricopeptide repeat protein [Isosphaeraceae bacterium]